FALDEGGVSEVVNGAFGPVILRVTNIEPAHVKAIEDVQDEIRTTIANDIALRSLSAVHDNYEQARSDGASMSEAAARMNLKTVTIEAVDEEGLDPDGKQVELPLVDSSLTSAFEADQGFDNDALYLGNTGYLWYQIDEVTPARERTLDEV